MKKLASYAVVAGVALVLFSSALAQKVGDEAMGTIWTTPNPSMPV